MKTIYHKHCSKLLLNLILQNKISTARIYVHQNFNELKRTFVNDKRKRNISSLSSYLSIKSSRMKKMLIREVKKSIILIKLTYLIAPA